MRHPEFNSDTGPLTQEAFFGGHSCTGDLGALGFAFRAFCSFFFFGAGDDLGELILDDLGAIFFFTIALRRGDERV